MGIRAGFVPAVHPEACPERFPTLQVTPPSIPVLVKKGCCLGRFKMIISDLKTLWGGNVRAAQGPSSPSICTWSCLSCPRGCEAALLLSSHPQTAANPSMDQGTQRHGLTQPCAGGSWGVEQAGRQLDDVYSSLPAAYCRKSTYGEEEEWGSFHLTFDVLMSPFSVRAGCRNGSFEGHRSPGLVLAMSFRRHTMPISHCQQGSLRCNHLMGAFRNRRRQAAPLLTQSWKMSLLALLGTGEESSASVTAGVGRTALKLAEAACSEVVRLLLFRASCPASPPQLRAHRPRGQGMPVFTPRRLRQSPRGCSRSCHRLVGLLAGSCPSRPSSRAAPGRGAAGHPRRSRRHRGAR